MICAPSVDVPAVHVARLRRTGLNPRPAKVAESSPEMRAGGLVVAPISERGRAVSPGQRRRGSGRRDAPIACPDSDPSPSPLSNASKALRPRKPSAIASLERRGRSRPRQSRQSRGRRGVPSRTPASAAFGRSPAATAAECGLVAGIGGRRHSGLFGLRQVRDPRRRRSKNPFDGCLRQTRLPSANRCHLERTGRFAQLQLRSWLGTTVLAAGAVAGRNAPAGRSRCDSPSVVRNEVRNRLLATNQNGGDICKLVWDVANGPRSTAQPRIRIRMAARSPAARVSGWGRSTRFRAAVDNRRPRQHRCSARSSAAP